MRHHLLAALAAVVALGGCSKTEESSAPARVAALAPQSKAAMGGPAEQRTMAYEHAIHVDAREDQVVAIYDAAQQACRAAVADACVVLESSLTTGQRVSATLGFRAKPAGIEKIVAALGAQGNVISKSTTAEDLAAPLEDSARKLAMLTDYRAKLESLRGRANLDVDALIKINKELAQVQSDIEARAGERAHLVNRVETEVLRVSIAATNSRAFWKPVGQALGQFASNLSEGISSVITGLAYLLPWALTLWALVWGVRKLLARWKRRKANA